MQSELFWGGGEGCGSRALSLSKLMRKYVHVIDSPIVHHLNKERRLVGRYQRC